MTEATYQLTRQDDSSEARVVLQGKVLLGASPALWAELKQLAGELERGRRLTVDLSGLQQIDGSTIALLMGLRNELKARGVGCELVGTPPGARALVELYGGWDQPVRRLRRRAQPLLAQVGQVTLELAAEVKRALAFLWELLEAGVGVVTNRRTSNWKDLAPLAERAGADALPIVALINLLVGFVIAFQAAPQLKQVGANIFVANLVSVSICRELGPLMTAIILSGRSGAAYAAELGTMAVSEELDALRTMGFDPLRFLVLPRVVVLIAMTPLLTAVADVVGILGGLGAAALALDVTPGGYLAQARGALDVGDVLTGLVKSAVFGAVIALVSCQQGLSTTGGAQGVGRRTTASVVSTLFALILVDSAFTVFFRLVEQWNR